MPNAETKCPPNWKTKVRSKNVKQLSLTAMAASNTMEAGEKINVVFIEMIINKNCVSLQLVLNAVIVAWGCIISAGCCAWSPATGRPAGSSYGYCPTSPGSKERGTAVWKNQGVVAVIAVPLQTHGVQSQAIT